MSNCWKTHVPIISVSRFIWCFFLHGYESLAKKFKKHWTKKELDNIEHFKANGLASFLRSVEYLYPLGKAGRRVQLNLLSVDVSNLEKETTNGSEIAERASPEHDKNFSNLLANFCDLEVGEIWSSYRTTDEKKKKKGKS